MKTVANLGSIQEAQSLKLMLGSFGIEAFIPDEISAGIAPYLFVGQRSGIRLQVPDDDEDEARRLLEEERGN